MRRVLSACSSVALLVAVGCSADAPPDGVAASSAASHLGSRLTLGDYFSGRATFVPDASFRPPAELTGDVETTTATWNGRHLMFYRTFTTGQPAIALATSSDGDVWTARDGGRPVIAHDTPGLDAYGAYAPSVYADGARLVLAYEAWPSANEGQTVAAATSTDGVTWTKLGTILDKGFAPWAKGNVGTPSITRTSDGGAWLVSFHGFAGTDAPGALARGVALGPDLQHLLRRSDPVITASSSGPWMERGPGRGDIRYEDGFYYMVLEGLSGSVLCVPNVTRTGWALARSTDLLHWDVRHVKESALTACGEDMPAFQVIGERTMVVSTTPDHESVHRWKLAPVETAPAAAVTCGQLAARSGWTAPACELPGTFACAGNGPSTSDCDHCCNVATTCGGAGGTLCETNGNGACGGIGPTTSDCAHCCGGVFARATCGAMGGARCESAGNAACGGSGAPSSDCDHCCR